MNWPLEYGWLCNLCGSGAYLEWGLTNGHCRCSKCHTEYDMKDDNGDVVTLPIWLLKTEYINAARLAWNESGKQLDKLTREEWNYFLEKASEK